MECVLCNSITNFFKSANKRDYYKCPSCMAVQLNPLNYVTEQQKINRYKTNNNVVFDKGYQNFVSPIFNSVINDFNNSTTGLDFGCGTGPVITKLLRDQNYTMVTYDPFFDNNEQALKETYNFIVCCEVIEHFHHPKKEFELLKSLLKPNGKLYCMTDLFNDTIDFEKWYYKNDETHVFFYQSETFQWIKEHVNF